MGPPNAFGMDQQRNAVALKPILLEDIQMTREDTRLCALPLRKG